MIYQVQLFQIRRYQKVQILSNVYLCINISTLVLQLKFDRNTYLQVLLNVYLKYKYLCNWPHA